MEETVKLVGFAVESEAHQIDKKEGIRLFSQGSTRVFLAIDAGKTLVGPVYGGTGLLYWAEYLWVAHLSSFVRMLHLAAREFDPFGSESAEIVGWYRLCTL